MSQGPMSSIINSCGSCFGCSASGGTGGTSDSQQTQQTHCSWATSYWTSATATTTTVTTVTRHQKPVECCCDCCPAFRPRYKRLVDNIYPQNPADGLVKNNMGKLAFYARNSPEKIDRIGEYLSSRVARDLYRNRMPLARIGMEAMDHLLEECRALNLFVESFLKTVQNLLESNDLEMQLMASRSFVKFSQIEEDAPSYHRRYDFFVSKFSSLAHNGDQDLETRLKLRLAGLEGLRGVIRKTVSDDLQVDIWQETHMDKIVPSLLYNMQCQDLTADMTRNAVERTRSESEQLAEMCLRELMSCANFGHIRSVIRPVLKHLDNHHLWSAKRPDPNFPVRTFQVIMHSIQAQHSYAVIQILMGHLDETSKLSAEEAKVRTGIVTVLSKIVAVAAAESIGPGVLEIINSLLRHLRTSINFCRLERSRQVDPEVQREEKHFQEAVIYTLGEFANNLPDFQKIEIMMFIMNKVPAASSGTSATDIQLQHILLKSLLRVSTKYRTVNMAHAFPPQFLRSLLATSLAPDPSVRLTVQHIFHQLLDRHSNLPRLTTPITLSPLPQIVIEKAHRQDIMFMKKYSPDLLLHVHENVQLDNNTRDNYSALYTTLSLLCIEMSSEETLSDLLRLTFALQDVAMSSTTSSIGLNPTSRSHVHGLVAAFLNLTAHLSPIPGLGSHIDQVIKYRAERAPWLLPDGTVMSDSAGVRKRSRAPDSPIEEDLLFSKTAVAEALGATGQDTSYFLQPFVQRTVTDSSMTRSASDLNYNMPMEMDSPSSSPGLTPKITEEVTFDSLRKILTETQMQHAEHKKEQRMQLLAKYKLTPFQDLISRQQRNKSSQLYAQAQEIFAALPDLSPSELCFTSPDDGEDELTSMDDSNLMTSPDEEIDGIPSTSTRVADQRGQVENDDSDSTSQIVDDAAVASKEAPAANVANEDKATTKVNGFFAKHVKVDPLRPPLFSVEFPRLFVY